MKTFTMITWTHEGRIWNIIQRDGKRFPSKFFAKYQSRYEGLSSAIYTLPAELVTKETSYGLNLLPIYFAL